MNAALALALAAVIGVIVTRSIGANDPVKAALPMLKSFEGFSPTKYWDYQQYSIGYGSRWEPGMAETITEPEAAALLEARIRSEYWPPVQAATHALSLSPGQLAALVSFCYNLGPGALSGGWMTAYKAGNYVEARSRFLSYVNPLPAVLVKRRRQEWYMLRTGTWNPAAANMSTEELPL